MKSALDAGAAVERADDRAPAAALWEHGTDLMAVVDESGAVGAANPAWQTMLHFAPDSIVGRSFVDLMQVEDRSRTRAGLVWARERGRHEFVARCGPVGGPQAGIAWSMASRDGSVFAIGREQAHSGAEPAVSAPGRPQRLLALGRVTSGIAHDFNNLLQSLRNSLELVRRRPNDEANVRRWTDNALHAVDRGARMTAQLLASSGAQRMEFVPVAAAGLLLAMRPLLERMLTPSVQLRIAPMPDAGSTLADPAQLEQAIVNLVLNACEAMPQGGEITISCERRPVVGNAELPSGEYLQIQVADTGPGMGAAVRERAFEPFFTTQPAGDGRGLGLSQVYAFSRRCGGTARIEPRSPHGGAAVSIFLPALALALSAAVESAAVPR